MIKKFTILTATYNCGLYLFDWANSIIAQDYKNIEVVLIDDCSKDNTEQVVKNISKKFLTANIKFLYIKNKKRLYCGSSYHLCLKHATGEYLGVLDADDVLEPFACSYVANLYNKYPQVSWIYTQHNKYNKRMDRVIKKGFCHKPKKKTLLYCEKKGLQVFSHWRTFSKRLKKINIFKKRLKGCVDKYMGYKMEELGVGLFANKVCYRYRRRTRGQHPISHSEPLRKIKREIIREIEERRINKNIYIYPIYDLKTIKKCQ